MLKVRVLYLSVNLMAVLGFVLGSTLGAEAATYSVAKTGSDSNVGTASTPWATITKANATLTAGDTVVILGGTYAEPIKPAQSGLDGQPILYKAKPGDRVVVTEKMRFDGKSYITVDGVRFESDGHAWFSDDVNTQHITLAGCEFDQFPRGENSAYVGLLSRGGYVTIRDCRFERWHEGDAIRMEGHHAWVEDNDFSRAMAGHGVLHAKANYVVIRRNYFRNPWDRALATQWVEPGRQSEQVLVEDNIIFDSNWNRMEPIPHMVSNESGADQVIKFNVSRGIFRNNLVVGCNVGKDYDYIGQIDLSSYGAVKTKNLVVHHEHLRIYHNTLYGNPHSGIRISRKKGYEALMRDGDIVIKNNIIAQHDQYSIRMDGRGIPFETYRVVNNVLTQGIRYGGQDRTVEEMEQALPEVFMRNSTGMPLFSNPDAIAQGKQNGTLVGWADFALQPSSPGKASGIPLTLVTASVSNSSTLRVQDALYFFDGFGMTEGDEITVVGSHQLNTRVTKRVDDSTLEVSPPVTVSSGDKVYLTRYGTSPDIGVLAK